MDEVVDSVKCPSLPSNYVTIVHLREQWLKEKERKQQEKENQENEEKKQYPVSQNHQNRIANRSTPVGKNLHKRENHSAKGWCEVGLIAKEPKLKEVKITARAVEEGEKKKKKGYFGKRKPRVERYGSRHIAKVSINDVGEEEMMAVVSMENGGKESSKGKCKEVEEVATVCMVEVVGRSNVDREIAGRKCGVGFREKKHSWRKMGDGVGEVSEKGDSVEQLGLERNGEKGKVSVDVKERTNEKVKVSGAFHAYGDKEVEETATVCAVEVVEENKVDREITGQKCRFGFRGKKHSWRKIGFGVGEVSDKANSAEKSGQECNAEKENVSIDVQERANEKVKVSGAFRAYGDKEVEEAATVYTVEVVEENKVDRDIAGQKCRVGFRGKKYSWRKIGDGVGEVRDKANSAEQSGQEHNAEKEKVSAEVKERTNEKVKVSGAFLAYGDKEVKEVASLKVVGENKIARETTGPKCRVRFKGKNSSWRRMGDGVGQVSDKDSGEQSGKQHNAEKEVVSVDVKERTKEKVKVSGAFCAYGDKEVEDVATVCTVEVVEENKVATEIIGQKCRVGFRGKKYRWRKIGDVVGQVSNKMDSGEQSGKQHNAEKEEVSVDVKERTDEKVKVSGAYSDKEVEEVATVCTLKVVEENKVDREITGLKCRVGFRGKKHSWRKIDDGVREVSDKANSAGQSGQERNAEKGNVSVDVKERTNEKVKVNSAFLAYGDKEVEEVASVCMVEVVGENKLDREITGQKCRVGFKGKNTSWRRMGDGVGLVKDKKDSEEQSEKQHNAEKEDVSVDVKERTNEKVKVSGAFRAYGNKEVEDVATVCPVEMVDENKVDREITGQKRRVGFRGKKHGWRKIGDRVGEVSDKANSAEQSGQEHNSEKEKVSIDVKERTNEKVRVRGAFRAYGDKSKDVLIDSEAGLKMTIERDLGDLSLTDRRYGHGRSSVKGYGDKWRYGSSRRYEPRKMLKQRDNSFVWIKKGESSNGNAAEIVTQVDVSSQSQSPSRSKLCTP